MVSFNLQVQLGVHFKRDRVTGQPWRTLCALQIAVLKAWKKEKVFCRATQKDELVFESQFHSEQSKGKLECCSVWCMHALQPYDQHSFSPLTSLHNAHTCQKWYAACLHAFNQGMFLDWKQGGALIGIKCSGCKCTVCVRFQICTQICNSTARRHLTSDLRVALFNATIHFNWETAHPETHCLTGP